MTNEAQRDAIRRRISDHTQAATANKETAKQSLIKEGMYTEEGKLTVQYGGEEKPSGK